MKRTVFLICSLSICLMQSWGQTNDFEIDSKGVLVRYKREGGNVVIPNSVTAIGKRAFAYCSSLTSVTIPGSVTSIAAEAFANCSSLTSLTIPASVTYIEEAAFAYCSKLVAIQVNAANTAYLSSGNGILYNKSMTTLHTYPAGKSDTLFIIPSSVTKIGGSAFLGCDNLLSISIPDSVTSIEESAFNLCLSLTSVTIPNSVTSIGKSAFETSGLTSITIPNSVTYIGEAAFANCSSLSSIHVDEGNTAYLSEYGILYNKSMTTLHTYPADYRSSYFGIPASVTNIGAYAFFNCRIPGSFTIPNTVTSIDEYAFWSCQGLSSLTIPNSVTSIGESAFSRCDYLTSVTISNSVTSIGEAAFSSCQRLTNIQVDARNTAYLSEDGVLYNKNKTILHTYPMAKIGTSFDIPSSVKEIGGSAFTYCSQLISITIPNSVTSIGENAFYNCDRIGYITIPNSVTSIGGNAFGNCYSLPSLRIPNSVKSIGDDAFNSCLRLSSVTIPNSVTKIGNGAFANCTGLKSVTVEWPAPLSVPDIFWSIWIWGSCVNTSTLSVPAGTKTLYEAADVWKDFGTITEYIPSAQTPYITAHPQGATYAQNAMAAPLSVTASVSDGGTLSFQWYSNPTNSITVGGTAIAGANSNFYTPSTAYAGTLYYYVQVTNTNSGVKATATSITAAITVNSVSSTFIPVTTIANVPATAVTGTPLMLAGTVVPSNATNQTVVWSVLNAGTTGATIAGNILYTTTAGTVTVSATVAKGISESSDYIQFFNITVNNYTDNQILAPANPLKATVNNGMLLVSGLIAGEFLNIYKLNGVQVYRNIAITDEMKIPLQVQGIYIIQNGRNTIKVFYEF